jgi:hypothetical protein
VLVVDLPNTHGILVLPSQKRHYCLLSELPLSNEETEKLG